VPTEAELARREGRSYEPASELLKRILAERKTHWIEDAAEKARAKAAEKARTAGQPWTARDDAATLEKERAKAAKQYKEPAAPDTTDLPELPEGWCWTRIEAVGDVQLGRQRSPKDHHGSHMRPYLRVANVYEDRIDTTDILEMNFTPYEFETYRLRPGDILLNEGQSLELIGRPAMYNGEVPGACFQNTLVRFTSSIAIERRYALMVFLAYMHSGVFQRIARWTTNIAHLGAGRFASLAFPLPPAEEQARIVAEVDRILGSIAAVAGNVQSGTCRAMRLRQSTLKWAFEGKLVEQDPNDEAAEALLERIRAERAAAGADKPRASERRSAE
jgi:type I restriction enzyme S subunit